MLIHWYYHISYQLSYHYHISVLLLVSCFVCLLCFVVFVWWCVLFVCFGRCDTWQTLFNTFHGTIEMLIRRKFWMCLDQLPAQSGTFANTNLMVRVLFLFLVFCPWKFNLRLLNYNFCCLSLALLSTTTKKCLALPSL